MLQRTRVSITRSKSRPLIRPAAFLEAIRRNSALPRHSAVVVTTDLPAPKIVAQEECEAFARYVAAMRRKSCNRAPASYAMPIDRRCVRILPNVCVESNARPIFAPAPAAGDCSTYSMNKSSRARAIWELARGADRILRAYRARRFPRREKIAGSRPKTGRQIPLTELWVWVVWTFSGEDAKDCVAVMCVMARPGGIGAV